MARPSLETALHLLAELRVTWQNPRMDWKERRCAAGHLLQLLY